MKRYLLTLAIFASIVAINVPAVGATNNRGRNPKGNNGVVKISDKASHDGIPNNNPHVECNFFIEFYNYDKNNNRAEVDFKMHAPTNKSEHSLSVAKGNVRPFIGEDEATGGTDLDAREEFKLNFTGDPHPKQGYHVKVTVKAPGSKGSDRKHKVFWVQPCGEVLEAQTEDDEEQKESTPHTLSTNTDELPAKGGGRTLPATGMAAAPALIGTITTVVGYGLHRVFSKES